MVSVEQTVRKVQAHVAAGEYYEAHQAVRTVVNRCVRARETGAAVALLYSSALLLLRAGQSGSGGDLLLYLLKVYTDARVKVEGASKGRVCELVYYIDPRDGVLKQIAQHATAWAIGEPDVAHALGAQLLRGGALAEAERYLLQGTVESAALLAQAHAALQAQAPTVQLAWRGVLGYLAVENVRNARAYLDALDPACAQAPLRQLVATCQTKDAQLYTRVSQTYKFATSLAAYADALRQIEKTYFGIVPYRQPSLADLFSAMA